MSVAQFARSIILLAALIISGVSAPHTAIADEQPRPMSLDDAILAVLEANLQAKNAQEEITAADYNRDIQQTKLLPTFSAEYEARHNYEEVLNPLFGVTLPQDLVSIKLQANQPIFAGGSLVNNYRIADLGLDIAKLNEQVIRQRLVFETKKAYFAILRAEKFVDVGDEAVRLLKAFEVDAKNFYEVGMTPLNDWLKAQVELANSRQQLITALNELESARANLNTLLRRSVAMPIVIKDRTDFYPFDKTFEECLTEAENHRLELIVARKNVDIGEKEVSISKKGYYPTVNLQGNYQKLGTDITANGGAGVSDPESWDVRAVASWNFWQWGRTIKGVKEQERRLEQTKNDFQQIRDNVRLEVKQAYLKVIESQKNIHTVEKAIEQAKENYRILDERYKHQAATSVEVLDGRTLLTRTRVNYYSALYDFKTAKAALDLAMGRDTAPEAPTPKK